MLEEPSFIICQKGAVERVALGATIEVPIHPGTTQSFVEGRNRLGTSKEGGFDSVRRTRSVKDVFSNRDRVNEEPLSEITPVIQRYSLRPGGKGSVIPIVYPRHGC